MHRFLAAALFAIALAGVALMTGPGARAETAIIEVVRDMGKIQLAQIWRERDITNCYLERIRRYLHMGRRGDAYALREIGFHYSKGWGVIRDLTKAYMWFTLAGMQGSQDALENRDTIAANVSAEQIARAEFMAKRWLET